MGTHIQANSPLKRSMWYTKWPHRFLLTMIAYHQLWWLSKNWKFHFWKVSWCLLGIIILVGILKGNSVGKSATELLGLLGFRTHFVVMLWAAVCFRKDCINHSACVFQTKTREAHQQQALYNLSNKHTGPWTWKKKNRKIYALLHKESVELRRKIKLTMLRRTLLSMLD